MAKDEDGEKSKGKKPVLVCIRTDAQSRELLTWSLINVAVAGDLVVALHILLHSSSDSVVASIAIAEELETMLAGYNGVCNLKQIDLKLKIVKGYSVREAVVMEANMYSASKVVLGIKIKSNGEPSASVAKYCSKRLRIDCTVVALHNGRIIFEKEVKGSRRLPKSSSFGSILGGATVGPHWYCLMSFRSRKKWDIDNTETIMADEGKDKCSSNSYDTDSPPFNVSKDKESVETSVTEKSEASTSCSSTDLVKESHEVCLSWPSLGRISLRKSVSFNKIKSTPNKLPARASNRKSSVDFIAKPKTSSQILSLNQANIIQSPFLPNIVEGNLPEELVALREKFSSVCRLFEYIELQQATSNFSKESMIGRGGSSKVYKGSLPDGQEVAVKILKRTERRLQEFVAEIETLTTRKHKNIISLFGFCLDYTNLILVYEYIPLGSLEDTLHGMKATKHNFSWSKRYKVALGIAEALDYLHGNGSTEPVFHMDVKSSNVLLSNNFEPQLCDFGLARLASKVTSELTCTNVTGTFGYLAPEYFLNGDVSEKIDVYAFGVVLLELISGRRPIATGPKGQENLVMLAKPIIKAGEFKDLIDPSLGNKYDKKELEQIILAASLCTRSANQSRPETKLVLELLRGNEDSIQWARMEVYHVKLPVTLDNEISTPVSASNIQTHINALFDTEDDLPSTSSTEPTVDSISANTSTDECLQWRWNRSFSFD